MVCVYDLHVVYVYYMFAVYSHVICIYVMYGLYISFVCSCGL